MPDYGKFEGTWKFYSVRENVDPPTLSPTPVVVVRVISIDVNGNITDAKDQLGNDVRGAIKLLFHDPSDVITIRWLTTPLYFRGTITTDRSSFVAGPKMNVAGRWQKVAFPVVTPEEDKLMNEQVTSERSDESLEKTIGILEQNDGTWHGTHP